MIIFQTDTNVRIDLSGYGVSLNEENPLFTDNIHKSYSLPFPVRADDELWEKLGLPSLDNITGVETKLRGKLLLPDRYYNAILFIGEIEGEVIECDLSFGDEELQVYDLDLKDLPWPIVLTPDLLAYANGVKDKSWPETPFNFPTVYNPKISEKDDYGLFKGFVNNYNTSGYWENSTAVDGEGATVYQNYNVMAPMVYLLEILRFGFSLEGKTISGPVVENELLKKVVLLPENYLEKFRGSEFQAFSFALPDELLPGTSINYGIHKRAFTLQYVGTYDLKLELNLDPVTAAEFELSIDQVNPTTEEVTNLFRAKSVNNRVKLEKDLKINVDAETQFDELIITLKIPYNLQSIAPDNRFELSFKDGHLNEHPSYFSLGDFMPDMSFGEYVNELKNWFNLDFDIRDNDVRIDFTQDSILEKPRRDHEHLTVPKPKKKHNSNRFYKLSYANNERVFYNRNGQVFSELDDKGDEVVEIKMDVQPAVVEQNLNVTTAVLPEDAGKLVFAVYSGLIDGKPLCDPNLIRELFLQAVFDSRWETWLRYRVYSKTFKESFECPVYEDISIKELSKKYNELHVIKKLGRKYLSEEIMKVDVESETF